MKKAMGVHRRTLLKSAAALSALAGLDVTINPPLRAAESGQASSDRYKGTGTGRSRAEGPLKITGKARYALEHNVPGMVHAVVIQSTVPAGRILSMDTAAASAAPGVLAVYTHTSGLKLNNPTTVAKGGAAQATYAPLQDDRIFHNGQNIGLVVARTLEEATWAASLVKTQYQSAPAVISMDDPGAHPQPVDSTKITAGDAAAAMSRADVTLKNTYSTPREYNMPMELHACISHWEAGKLTVWDPSQWVAGSQRIIAEWMGLERHNVRIISPYVGGGFGSKPVPYNHVALACLASRALGVPVKLSLTRPQTFTGFGGRAATSQTLEIGATRDGKIVSLIHEGFSETSTSDTFAEATNRLTGKMYAISDISSVHNVVPMNTVTPGWMRAPGDNPSAFGIEIAMDEMAYELGLDPLRFRELNWADRDYQANLPWTSRRLKEAYRAGAEAFGWSQRNHTPRSMREGRELIGWGMASGAYPVNRMPAEARLVLSDNGILTVQSAGADIGTGTYTILAQAAAEVLKIPSETIQVELGDSSLPLAGVAGGSQLAGNLMAAIHKTAGVMREALLQLASETSGSPLYGLAPEQMKLADGAVVVTLRPSRSITYRDLLLLSKKKTLIAEGSTFDSKATEQERQDIVSSITGMVRSTANGVSAYSWSALFVEVRVDEDFGTVRVKRVVGAFDCGRLYNPTLAHSQWTGGIVMGIGQALLEEGIVDPEDGRILNNNLADYMVAVNADIPEITTISVGEPDYRATAMGGKTVGEVGIVGVAAAISNAVYHATGKRIRDLPVTMDKLI